MHFNLVLPNNVISITLSALSWIAIIGVVLRQVLKQQKAVPWKAYLVTLIGVFSFTISLDISNSLVKIPLLPLGVWIVYGFLRNKSWKTYRVYAWIGFWANFLFLLTTLLSVPIHHWVYSKTEAATYIGSIDHAVLIQTHPSAIEVYLQKELFTEQLKHLQLTPFDSIQWYQESIVESDSNYRIERFPYQLTGTLPRWGSGLSTVIYLENDGRGLLITTPDRQYYYRSEEPLIQRGDHQS